jgi:hypothetical protein
VVAPRASFHVCSGRQHGIGSSFDGAWHHGVLSVLLRYHGWEKPYGAKQSVLIHTDQSTSSSNASVHTPLCLSWSHQVFAWTLHAGARSLEASCSANPNPNLNLPVRHDARAPPCSPTGVGSRAVVGCTVRLIAHVSVLVQTLKRYSH